MSYAFRSSQSHSMPEPSPALLRTSNEVARLATRIHEALSESDLSRLERALLDASRLNEASARLRAGLTDYVADVRFFR
jgi:hypothetical protein